VIPSVSPLRGGPSVAVRAVARSLVQAGIEVHVATTDDNGNGRLEVPQSVPVKEEGISYWYFPRQTHFYTFSWPLTRWLEEHVREYDLVHIHALFSYAAIPAAYWAARCKIPYIVRPLGVLNRWGMENRHPWLKTISFKLIERRILAGAAAVHFTSDQECLEAAELGISQNSVVIPNAVEIPEDANHFARGRFRSRHPGLADRLIILFLSRLDPKKGLDILLPAFGQVRVRHPRAALVVAGNGEPALTAHLQQEAVRLRIGSDIFWAGFLSGAEKWAALADADIFVLPSYSENFGVAVVEAMACGLPVIVSDQVGIHREIAAAQAGLAVPCRVTALTEALTQLVADTEMRSRMGANGRHLARSEFSLEAVTDALIRLYTAICKPALGEALA
jgi:glycosyltransferase involved in cell wall biosynthesis